MTTGTHTISRRQFSVAALGAVGALSPLASGFAAESGDDWVVASPTQEGIDAAALQRTLDGARSIAALRSVVVVRNGLLVGEQYYGGASAGDLQALHSATKSVASMLVGIAIGQGKIPGVSATLDSLLPAAAAKPQGAATHGITLEQILTGTTGLVYDFTTQMKELEAAADPVDYALGLPLDPAKPASWVYNDAAVSLLAPVLARAGGRPIEDIATRDLFGPLGISRFAGARDKAGHVMSHRGLRLCARDFAKLAWTMANRGRWRDAQVVPADWVDQSTRFHVPTTWRAAPVRRTGYGYLWFTGELSGHPVAWAWGYGAQFALIVPTLRLAVTTTATAP
ncbi:MAG: beta-lactamase family protein, partial [Gammaproteobacteria bacterium]|nr:beta-lactamase family protein [Gammaproteobacteria bacterium]